MSIAPSLKAFWQNLRGRRNAWDRLTGKEIDENLFAARATFNQWTAKVQACNKEEFQHKARAATVHGPQRMLLAQQAIAARRRALTATRVAQAMMGVIEALDQLKMNREAYAAMKSTGAADLARLVGQLEVSRDVLGQKLVEIESVPLDVEMLDAGLNRSDADLGAIMREIESIETLKAEGKSEPEIESALKKQAEPA